MKNLRVWGSGLSPFFVPEDFVPTRPSVREDLNTDVLVIGGGLSGLLCAVFLLRAGREVTVVTANTVGDGATRYGAGVHFGDGGPDLRRLFRTFGREKALSWYRLAASSVNLLEKTVRETGSRCGFRRRDGVLYTALSGEREALREEYRLRLHSGTPCTWMDREACEDAFSFPCVGGIRIPGGGAEFNAVKLSQDLSDWISLHGGRVFEGSRVESVEAASESLYYCQCGAHRVSAQAVVDCRGGEVLGKNPSLGQRMTVYSVVTEPVSLFRGWPDRCLIRSWDEGFLLRTTEEGRIVFTGEATSGFSPEGKMGGVLSDSLCRIRYRNLEEMLREMFYGIPRVRVEYRFRQSGVMPAKGLPYFGRDARWKGLYYLYAFGEGGLAGALIGAARLSRMICEPGLTGPDWLTLP